MTDPDKRASDRYWFAAKPMPGTLRPSVWMESHGSECSRWSMHRTMLAARLRAWWENRKRGLRHG